MSLYSKYIAEREGLETIEDSRGFATYKFLDSDRCYIESIFVEKDFRNTNLASEMADKISAIARERGCTKLVGSVCPSANGATASLKVLLAYGFHLESSSNNFIVLVKDLV